jgi:glycosyltransferase involved in cell wall biosynthesis
MLNKNHFIVKWWEKVNVKVLDNAYRLITIGEGMKSKISSYVSPDKIEIISCWTDSEFLKPVPKSKNKFIVDNKFEGKFLVLYSGNLGVTHDVEILVYLAELSKRNNLHFIIIGEGDKKRFIADLIQERKLSNIDLLSWQPVEMLPFSLSAADIAVVTLGTGASLMSVPSKLYDTMAVGSPLLIISEPEAEMARIVEDHNIGRSFQNGQLEEMLDFIYELMDNSETYLNFRENALAASKHFTPYNAKSFKAINKNM